VVFVQSASLEIIDSSSAGSMKFGARKESGDCWTDSLPGALSKKNYIYLRKASIGLVFAVTIYNMPDLKVSEQLITTRECLHHFILLLTAKKIKGSH
jgi:hypothetical protein